MKLFKNYWFRCFAITFTVGALLPVVAFTTDQFKDLEITSGKLSFSGLSAWIAAALFCGVFFGIAGLGITALTTDNRKSS